MISTDEYSIIHKKKYLQTVIAACQIRLQSSKLCVFQVGRGKTSPQGDLLGAMMGRHLTFNISDLASGKKKHSVGSENRLK